MRQVRPSWQKSNWSKLAVGGLFVALVGSLHAVNLEVFGPSCSIPPPQPPPLRDLNGYFPFQVPDNIEKGLGSSHRKGRDNQYPAPVVAVLYYSC